MLAKPFRIGDWELKGNLGQGGFGEVKHWKNRSTNQEIATKHIKDANRMGADQQDKLRERWLQEYKWTREFKEAFIVAGLCLGDENFVKYLNSHHVWDLPVIILEYCNGGDVRKLLQRPQNANGLTEFEVREILGTLRKAVHFLHSVCHIFHRDLKPDNIVIHRSGNGRKIYKLTDFGLARNAPDQTILQSVVGTRHYYAPEVVDSAKYNTKVDYWSMGIITYELATGVLPFIPHRNACHIHENLRKKSRDCIAITEDPLNRDQFIYHTEIPMGHHLSKPWLVQFTKWLPLALDTNYSQRGVLVATDEVQYASTDPAIFSEIDLLQRMKVLTLFAACYFKRLEYEVTPSMTMQQLGELIKNDTGLCWTTSCIVLPTGHPHKQLRPDTTPLDLYVDEWCDTSEESINPPVMVFIFNGLENCIYTAPDPTLPSIVRHFINNEDVKLQSWLADRLALDMHHVLITEQALIKSLLFGFREYILLLEHDILQYRQQIELAKGEMFKCTGAIDQFHALVAAAQEQQKFHVVNKHNNNEWQSNKERVISQLMEILNSINKIVHHFESTLHNVRNELIKEIQEIYDKNLYSDVYKIKDFQRNYLRGGDSMTSLKLSGIAIDLAKARHGFLKDKRLKHLRESLHQTHLRFYKAQVALNNARENLRVYLYQLLQSQLEMIPSAVPTQQPSIIQLDNAMSRMSFNTVNGSMDAFDSLITENIVTEALAICQKLENDMDVDRSQKP